MPFPTEVADPESRDGKPNLALILTLALLLIVVGGTVDLILDDPQSWLSFHVVFELSLIAGALLMAVTLWLGWWRSARSVEELTRTLEERSEERDRWRKSAEHAIEGFARAIDSQFERWSLTPSEREVALLLLKGHSHKGIARRTDRSPQTVRQHAASVYGKASIGGRAELAAFFLEDLVLPEGEGDPNRGPAEVGRGPDGVEEAQR